MGHVGVGERGKTSSMAVRPASGTNSPRSTAIRMKIAAPKPLRHREHAINQTLPASHTTRVSHKQPNGTKTVVAGATMEDDHRNLASNGCYLKFVVFLIHMLRPAVDRSREQLSCMNALCSGNHNVTCRGGMRREPQIPFYPSNLTS